MPFSTCLPWTCAVCAIIVYHNTLKAQDVTVIPAELDIRAELVSNVVFPGEMPIVRLITLAPKDRSVQVIKADRAAITGALSFTLLRGDRSRVPGGHPHDGIVPPQEADYIRLDAGKIHIVEEPILSRPPAPGDYIVRVEFLAGPKRTQGLSTDLRLKCHAILDSMVRERCIVQKAGDLPQPFHNVESELINIEFEGKCVLVFRKTDARDGVLVLQRLMACDANTRMAAALVTRPHLEPIWAETWFTCNIGSDLIFGRIESTTGKLVESRSLRETFRKGSQK